MKTLPPPRQTFTQGQIIEMVTVMAKVMQPYVALSEEDLVKSVSKGVVMGLQIAGVELPPWIATETTRKN